MGETPHSKYQHVYAVVRLDLDMSRENSFTVVKVLTSKESADQEVSRLNHLNGEKGARYEVQTTRLVS